MLNIAFVHHFKLEWELETFDSAIVCVNIRNLYWLVTDATKLTEVDLIWNQIAIIQDSCGLREIQLPEKYAN